MPRVLFVSHTKGVAGPAHSLIKLIEHLRPAYESAVLVPGQGTLVPALQAADIPAYAQSMRIRRLPHLVWLLRRHHFDLVYANSFSYNGLVGYWAAKLAGKPFVWHIREVLDETVSLHWVRRADAVVAVSQAVKDVLLRSKIDPAKITVVYNGIDLDDFTIARQAARDFIRQELDLADDALVVATAGHVRQLKNQRDVVAVAAQLRAEYPQIVFAVLGRLDYEPAYTAQLKDLIAHENVRTQVRLLGFQSNVPTYLSGSDVYLHTSRIEAHPRSVIEAMAARLPVVAYATGGIPETVGAGETGLLTPLGDTAGLAAHLGTLIADPALRHEMGARGRERVEQQFTADRTAQQISAIIQRALEQRK